MIEIETLEGNISTCNVDEAIDLIRTAKDLSIFIGYSCDYPEDNEYIWENLNSN